MVSTADPAPRFRKACVVGLGVVGIPVAAKLAEVGLTTVGLDVDATRVRSIADGRYPFTSEEPGMQDLLSNIHAKGLLIATTDPEEAVTDADVVVVVVQTPVEDAKTGPRYDALRSALTSVGSYLKKGALVVVESTLAPGTMRDIVRPTLEKASGFAAGRDFGLGHCPERVMPGKLLHNIVHYDRVVGGIDPASIERMLALYRLYVTGTLYPTDMTTAEVVKTAENAYRDIEIAFANEVARICQGLGVDAWEVRAHVNRVEGRNMHLPGIGVGGHCIPKDGLLLAHAARDFIPRMLLTARDTNDGMPEVTARLLAETLASATKVRAEGLAALQGKTIVVLGAAYLPGSDDTRLTPSAPFIRILKEAGAEVRLVDPYVEALEGTPALDAVTDALDGAHGVVLSTAHTPFLAPEWAHWAERMALPVAIDGRGAWDPEAARAAGFHYRGVGR
ncbi:MAG: nucleotide sugar dehydrogenase [Euryarchaeota archaeon]|nr:nucleotide sugar dehydrogenase [Euryarchaeota archaeon]